MLGIGLEEILLVSIVKHAGESAIVSSRRFPREFLQIELKFPSDREDSHVKMDILFSLVLLGTCGRGETLGNK